MSEPTRAEKLSDRVASLRLGDRANKPPASASRLPWAFVVVLLFACALLGYRAYRVSGVPSGEAKVPPAPKAGDRPSLPDSPSPASSAEVVLQSKGYVVPISLKQISPRVSGELVWVDEKLFLEGTLVEKGALLARIDPKEFDFEVRQAEAAWLAAKRRHEDLEANMKEEIAQAEADLDEAKNNAVQMKLEMDRNARLGRGSAVAQKEIEQAEYGYRAMAAKQRRLESTLRMLRDPKHGRLALRSEAAKQDMDQAKARLGTARMRRDWCDIKAPITGTILTKKAERYNLVNPAAFSSGISASLCEMADLQQLEIDLTIQERDIALVEQGQKCLVMPEAYSADKRFLKLHPQGYEGKVSRIMPNADRAKGAIPVRVLIEKIPADEAGKYLRPEMGALVSFKGTASGDKVAR
ncbi:MAG: efflux RND transporter periplasmic adaptor subunit [Gemmataceae bacterium]|nr:efflux RND transporter periplasmic adaptor subunit [Gemmataceae bacterium]